MEAIGFDLWLVSEVKMGGVTYSNYFVRGNVLLLRVHVYISLLLFWTAVSIADGLTGAFKSEVC